MNSKEIIYYVLEKDLPGQKAGSVVTRSGVPGETEYLLCGPFNFPIDYLDKHSEWFRAVTLGEHQTNFKSSFVEYGKSLGKTDAQIEHAWTIFNG